MKIKHKLLSIITGIGMLVSGSAFAGYASGTVGWIYLGAQDTPYMIASIGGTWVYYLGNNPTVVNALYTAKANGTSISAATTYQAGGELIQYIQ